MNNSPPLFDSPRGSAFFPLQPIWNPVHPAQAAKSSDSLEEASSDNLSALPGSAIPPSPYRSIRNEQTAVPSSSLPPSLRRSPGAQAFITPLERRDVGPLSTEGSTGQNSSQRVSFDGTPASTPNHSPRMKVRVHPLLRQAVSQTPREVELTTSKMNHPSGPTTFPSPVPLAAPGTTPKKPGYESPLTASASHSRTTSPLRRRGWSGFHRAQEDAFIPVDPFRLRTRLRRFSLHSDIESYLPFDAACEENPFCCIIPNCSPEERVVSFLRDARYFIMDTLPRQIYLHLLFRLPSLYWSRIAKLYEDAQISKPDLECMVEACFYQQRRRQRFVPSSPIPPGAHYHPAPPLPDEWTTANVSPALFRFKQSWEAFIDSLLREWKTLNLVSALLHSAIISMFQIQVIANDPVIRTAALLSLTSALMSLSYGCIYIVRFGTMRSMFKAARWAEEAARTTTFIMWNVWVLLAMPAVWLSWSMMFFIVAILAFVWRYGSSADPVSPQPLSPTAALGPRIAISAWFFLGLLYLCAIVKTLHNYGLIIENRPSRRATLGNGIPNIPESDTRGGEQASQREHGTSYGRESDQAHRGRERTRSRTERDATVPGGLPAVTGLGLRGLDEVASPHSSDEMSGEKQRIQTEASA